MLATAEDSTLKRPSASSTEWNDGAGVLGMLGEFGCVDVERRSSAKLSVGDTGSSEIEPALDAALRFCLA